MKLPAFVILLFTMFLFRWVLTKKLADKYYGEQADYTNVLGKLMYIGDTKTLLNF